MTLQKKIFEDGTSDLSTSSSSKKLEIADTRNILLIITYVRESVEIIPADLLIHCLSNCHKFDTNKNVLGVALGPNANKWSV
jgi:hypothetical protein